MFSSLKRPHLLVFSSIELFWSPDVCRLSTHFVFSHFLLLLRNCWANFNQTSHKAPKHSWVKGILFCSNERSRPFPRGDNYEIAKILWQLSKIFSTIAGLISIKLFNTKHPWVKGIQVCSIKHQFLKSYWVYCTFCKDHS